METAYSQTLAARQHQRLVKRLTDSYLRQLLSRKHGRRWFTKDELRKEWAQVKRKRRQRKKIPRIVELLRLGLSCGEIDRALRLEPGFASSVRERYAKEQ